MPVTLLCTIFYLSRSRRRNCKNYHFSCKYCNKNNNLMRSCRTWRALTLPMYLIDVFPSPNTLQFLFCVCAITLHFKIQSELNARVHSSARTIVHSVANNKKTRVSFSSTFVQINQKKHTQAQKKDKESRKMNAKIKRFGQEKKKPQKNDKFSLLLSIGKRVCAHIWARSLALFVCATYFP